MIEKCFLNCLSLISPTFLLEKQRESSFSPLGTTTRSSAFFTLSAPRNRAATRCSAADCAMKDRADQVLSFCVGIQAGVKPMKRERERERGRNKWLSCQLNRLTRLCAHTGPLGRVIAQERLADAKTTCANAHALQLLSFYYSGNAHVHALNSVRVDRERSNLRPFRFFVKKLEEKQEAILSSAQFELPGSRASRWLRVGDARCLRLSHPHKSVEVSRQCR